MPAFDCLMGCLYHRIPSRMPKNLKVMPNILYRHFQLQCPAAFASSAQVENDPLFKKLTKLLLLFVAFALPTSFTPFHKPVGFYKDLSSIPPNWKKGSFNKYNFNI